MVTLRIAALGAALFLLGFLPASAQQLLPTVVASCPQTSVYANAIGQQKPVTMDINGTLCTGGGSSGGAIAEQGSSSPSVGITPSVASNATALNAKGSQGNLYHDEVVNATSTLGYLIEYNAAAPPTAGSTLVNAQILGCHLLPASGEYNPARSPGPPKAFSSGIQLLVSSTSCAGATVVYTTGTVTAFIEAEVR